MYILLNLLKKSDIFNESIYDYTLHDCTFLDYTPNTEWRKRHASSMVPMYVSSQRSQATLNFGSINHNMFLMTQKSLEFELTPSTLSDEKKTYINNKSSSLLFDFESDNQFKNPNNIEISSEYRQQKNRRFNKDKTKIGRQFAFREVNKKIEKEETRKEFVKQKEHSVRLFRKYRDGEFPDIQIPLADIIKPLQMLAKHDPYIGKLLFVALFDLVANKTKNAEAFYSEAHNSILNIFMKSTDYTPSLIGTLLDVAFCHKNDIQFDPNLIMKVSEESGLMSVGSLILEEYLCNETFGCSSSKISNNEDEETNLWIKLAK